MLGRRFVNVSGLLALGLMLLSFAASPVQATTNDVPRCRSNWLTVEDAGGAGVAAGTAAESIRFRTSQSCWARGEPSVWLVSAAGRRLATAPRNSNGGSERIVITPRRPAYAL